MSLHIVTADMETFTEDINVNNKQEMLSQLLCNKGNNNDRSHKLKKKDAHQEETKNIHKDSLRKSAEADDSPSRTNLHTVSKVDAATMTDAVGESYFEQEVASKSQYNEVTTMLPSSAWHSFSGATSSPMVEYLSRLTASTLPLTFHHFLKYSAAPNEESNLSIANKLLKEKGDLKNEPKEKNSKQCCLSPTSEVKGNDVLTTALDGSMLFCCPECHMAYPEKELLQQHLLVHQLERRFVCDICGAGLKRKEHLDRHKQGHSPDRPYTCSICLKAFKRNEHLSRHFITHSGDKSQICIECGKGFYRKDHLHKHAQSHIAKRLRTEFYGKRGDIGTSYLSNEDESPVTLRSDVPSLSVLSS